MTLNSIGISLNKSLIKSGINGLAKCVELNPTEITSIVAGDFIRSYYPKAQLVFLDGKYKVITWDKWQEIDGIIYDIVKKQYEKEHYDCYVPLDTAFALGLFFSDGTCGLKENTKGGSFWAIVNGNLKHLERAKKGLEEAHKDFNFVIKEFEYYKKGKITNLGERKQTLYCLQMKLRKDSNIGKRYNLIKEYRNMFYFPGKEKKVPRAFFDDFPECKKAFLDGVIAGDGLHNPKNASQTITVNRNNPVGVSMLNWILFSLGIKYSVDVRDKEYSIRFNYKLKPLLKTACDNKGYVHKYWTDRIFNIPQFIVHGHRYDTEGKWLDGHFWCAKISDGKLYFLEPEGNKSVKIEKGKPVFIGEKEYRPLIFEY